MRIDSDTLFIAALFITWLIQLFYYLWFMLKAANYKTGAISDTHTPPVSVIICAKNEADNLRQFLPKILNQDYPDFEVVVVNDASSDDSDLVLAGLKKEYPHLYYTSIPTDKKFYQGKKLALNIGIKAAQNEHLVLTDADCYPESDQWLHEMTNAFKENVEIVIGYGKFQKKKSIFNLFLRYETFFNTVQYMGFALRKKPYMAVGRNMAYKKSLFLKSGGFKNHLTIASGDDDLFIKECATKSNTAVVMAADSQTVSVPPRSFKEWMNRKSRHLTTAKYYSFYIKWWLGLEPISRQLFWTLGICSLFFPNFVFIGLALILSRVIIQYLVLGKASKVMNEKGLFWFTLLLDLAIPIIIGSVWLRNFFSANKKKWK